MSSALSKFEWERLREMRAGFLEAEVRDGDGVLRDYFHSARDVELYDAAFGTRIEWKWAAVLREVALRAPDLAPTSVADWACGTGAATRAVLASPLGASVRRVTLWDRSEHAVDFARRSLAEQWPHVRVEVEVPEPPDLLIASHVLDELDAAGEAQLQAAARRAGAVLLVESGASGSSRRLGALRERLLDEFAVLAPCTHSSSCGALASRRDWCHFFARPPAEAFTEPFWSEFSRELGVDLRSLSYSFVALARRPRADEFGEPGWARILGRPRKLKGRALVDACLADGLRTVSLLERLDRALFRTLDASSNDPRVWRLGLDGDRVSSVERQ